MTSPEQPATSEYDQTDSRTAGGYAVAETVAVDTGENYHVPEVPDGIMTASEVTAWADSNGFSDGRRGTFKNGESYLYVKWCHRVGSEDDVEPALAAMRYMTSQGMLHPATRWGAFKYDDAEYQLFAVSPKIEAWSLNQIDTEESARLERSFTDEASARLEWIRRLDPTATVGKGERLKPVAPAAGGDHFDDFFEFDTSSYAQDEIKGSNPLTGLLNLAEARHLDNWGWDDSGNIYPVDVEVIRINGDKEMDAIREWYSAQRD